MGHHQLNYGTSALLTIAEFKAVEHTNHAFKIFEEPSPINVAVSREDYVSGYLQGAEDQALRRQDLKTMVNTLVTISFAYGEGISHELALQIEQKLASLSGEG